MHKTLKILLLFISIFLFTYSVKAIKCEYPDAKFTITYDKNDAPHVTSTGFASSPVYMSLFGFVKFGSKIDATSNIQVDQTLFEKYQGKSCPDNMKVCYYSESSLDLPSIKTAIGAVTEIVALPLCGFGTNRSDVCNGFTDNAYSLLTINKQILYILTENEYSKSDISKYEGGVVSSSPWDNLRDGYETCSVWGIPVVSQLLGGICAAGNLVINVAGDSTIGDGVKLLYIRNTMCETVKYTGKYPAFDVNCSTVQQAVFRFRDALDNYKKCKKDSCKSKKASIVNEKEELVKMQCKAILENYDYSGASKSCLDNCLKMGSTLNNYKKGTDLYIDLSGGKRTCSMSQDIISFIHNILKWVKYLAPVLVIILGIIDFIKALAAQDDDAMKKAQGKFIKRLVAAVLLFLLPLIIDYILRVFDLVDSNCNIIDIF